MNPKTIHLVDRWLGIPACWLLTRARWVGDFVRGRPQEAFSDPPQKILFIKLVELGANVQAYAALRRAAEMVGRENVYFWVFDENRPILELLDVVPRENLLVIRSDNLARFVLDTLKTLRRIRQLRIDAVVDMEFFARASALLAYLTGARRRVGLHRFTCEGVYRGDLMTHRVGYNPYTHVSRYFHLLVEALVSDPREIPLLKCPLPEEELESFCFEPTEQERAELREMLAASGVETAGPLVLLNPNASDIVPVRRWPTERFVEVGQKLLASHDELTVVVTGSPAEQDVSADVVRRLDSPRAVSLAGKTTLRQLLVLYGLSDVLVTNDSGPGQFASMTPIHAVVLFGPETPAIWKPLGPRVNALWAGLACSPCVNPFNYRFSPCRNPRCMTDLTVEAVVSATEKALRQR